jgi:hypothetical protein
MWMRHIHPKRLAVLKTTDIIAQRPKSKKLPHSKLHNVQRIHLYVSYCSGEGQIEHDNRRMASSGMLRVWLL